MEFSMQILQKTAVFQKMSEAEILEVLTWLPARSRQYRKGDTVLFAGNPVSEVGVVLHGSVFMENNDAWGNRSILGSSGPGDTFAETYAILGNEPLMVTVVAAEPTEILFLDLTCLQLKDTVTQPGYHHFISNLLLANARKNRNLTRRINYVSAKTIRRRLLTYLSDCAMLQQSQSFTIPFNRQQLADYLHVDRSALSSELGKMQAEGLLQYHRNQFILCHTEEAP